MEVRHDYSKRHQQTTVSWYSQLIGVYSVPSSDGCEYSRKTIGCMRQSHRCTFPDREDFLFDGWKKKIQKYYCIQPLEGHPVGPHKKENK